MELLYVRQVESTGGTGSFRIFPHIAFEIPVDGKLPRYHRVGFENAAVREIDPEAFEYNHVGRQDEESFGVFRQSLHHRV